MYKGDPNLVNFAGSRVSSITLENPKSEILILPSCNNKLAGLISLCIIFFLFKSLKPSQMCLKKRIASDSVNLPFLKI